MSLRKPVIGLLLAAFMMAPAWAQQATQELTQRSVLRPPKGQQVALIAFEDMQCPDCSRAEIVLLDARKAYGIPLVRFDFPLPMHNWAFDAAVIAKYLDSVNAKVGDEFRTYIYANQPQITPQNLRQYAEKYCQSKGVALPFVIDPNGEFEKKVKADFALGQRVGINHTPTIYVVNNGRVGTPFIEVVDRTNLFRIIDEMKRTAAPVEAVAKPAPKKIATKKK